MYKVALSLGANIEPKHHIVRTIDQLADRFELLRISPVYKTEPVGMEPGADPFHNLCVLIRTELEPPALKQELRSVERREGRKRSNQSGEEPYEPRRIDIDILCYDPPPADFEPSPELTSAAFVVYPLSDIMAPPGVTGFETAKEWRSASSPDQIIEILEYDWPDGLVDRVEGPVG